MDGYDGRREEEEMYLKYCWMSDEQYSVVFELGLHSLLKFLCSNKYLGENDTSLSGSLKFVFKRVALRVRKRTLGHARPAKI